MVTDTGTHFAPGADSDPDSCALPAHASGIFERITDAFFALDTAWRFVYLNAEAERLFQHTRDELISKTIWETFPEAVDSAFWHKYHEALASQTPVSFAEYYPPFDSWYDVRAYPASDGLSIFFRDISVYKRAEEALRVSEQQLRAQYQGFPAPTFTWQRQHDEWVFIEYNKAADTLTNGLIAHQLGTTAAAIYHDLPEMLEAFACCDNEQTPVRREVSWRFAPEDPRDLIVNLVYVPSDIVIMHLEDITEQKRAVKATHEQNQYLEGLHEVSLSLMRRLDLTDVLHAIIQRAGELLGTEHGFVDLVKEDGTLLEFIVGHGMFDVEGIVPVRPGQGLGGTIWQTGQPLRIDDYPHWQNHMHGPHLGRICAVIGAPLVSGSEVIGVLGLAHSEPGRTFDDAGVALLSRFAQLAAIALDNARLYQAAQQEVHERRDVEAALRESEARYRSLVEQSPDAIIVHAEMRYVYVNEAAIQLFGGKRPEDILGRSIYDFVLPEERDTVRQRFDAGAEDWKRTPLLQTKRRRLDGEIRDIESIGIPIMYNGKPAAQVIYRDVTDRNRTELERREAIDALRANEQRFRALIEKSMEGIALLDANVKILYASPSTFHILGYTPEEFMRANLLQLFHPEDRKAALQRLSQRVNEIGKTSEVLEFRVRHKDGAYRWLESTGTNLLDDPAVGAIVVNYRDITQRKETEQQLVHNVLHDALTGLPNRGLFLDLLERAIEYSRKRARHHFAVLFLDFDRFKNINDSLGHLHGDRLLIAIARRLKDALGAASTIARLGGDEFAVLVEEIDSEEDAIQVAEGIQRVLTMPVVLRGIEIFITTSIGIALDSPKYQAAEEMLRDADTAMYRAKAQGAGHYAVFNAAMHTQAVARFQIESDLRRAIARDEFTLRYQPITSIDTGEITGFEALVRWQHPRLGLLSPKEFIPIAEETGMILAIDRWVLREACRQTHAWVAESSECAHLAISVNVSGKHFAQLDFLKQIMAIVDETDIAPERLKLEITESTLIEHTENASAALWLLRAAGIQIHLDDFGTGYSSLGYLRRFPIDVLKIDRAFISGSGDAVANPEIVKAVVDLAHNLGITVIAEGIETARQREQLQMIQCDYGQGRLFSPLLTGRDVPRLLRDASPHRQP